ncbi:MAG: hypothetical protein ACOY4Q_01215 [Bacillota bacterium]
MKIAVASDDWMNVDRPLEKDGQFLILDVTGEKINFGGVRKLYHAENDVLRLLEDCKVVFCREGDIRVKELLETKEKEVIETRGFIPRVLYKYLEETWIT